MDADQIIAALRADRPPCLETLGDGHVVEVDPQAGTAVMAFTMTPAFCHSGTVVQGGFVTGMLDAAMAHAALAARGMADNPLSLELKVSFLETARPGPYRAYGRMVRMGRSIGFSEAELIDAEGRKVAVASSTFRFVRMPAAIPG